MSVPIFPAYTVYMDKIAYLMLYTFVRVLGQLCLHPICPNLHGQVGQLIEIDSLDILLAISFIPVTGEPCCAWWPDLPWRRL